MLLARRLFAGLADSGPGRHERLAAWGARHASSAPPPAADPSPQAASVQRFDLIDVDGAAVRVDACVVIGWAPGG